MKESKLGNIPILDTINKIPGGLMVVPLFLGVIVNSLFPNFLEIGSFTTALFKNGANALKQPTNGVNLPGRKGH